jgi:hypothetical protein
MKLLVQIEGLLSVVGIILWSIIWAISSPSHATISYLVTQILFCSVFLVVCCLYPIFKNYKQYLYGIVSLELGQRIVSIILGTKWVQERAVLGEIPFERYLLVDKLVYVHDICCMVLVGVCGFGIIVGWILSHKTKASQDVQKPLLVGMECMELPVEEKCILRKKGDKHVQFNEEIVTIIIPNQYDTTNNQIPDTLTNLFIPPVQKS